MVIHQVESAPSTSALDYFSSPTRINKNELNVEWFPTNYMIGDSMTKPTNGIFFKKFRYLIMGFIPIKKDIRENETKKKSK